MKKKTAHFALPGSSTERQEHNAPRGGLLRGCMRLQQSRICAPGDSQTAKLWLPPPPKLSLWQKPRNTQAPKPSCPSPLPLPKIYFTFHWGSLMSSLLQSLLELPRDKQAASAIPCIVSRSIPSGLACLMEHELCFSSWLTEWTQGKKKVSYTSLLY